MWTFKYRPVVRGTHCSHRQVEMQMETETSLKRRQLPTILYFNLENYSGQCTDLVCGLPLNVQAYCFSVAVGD